MWLMQQMNSFLKINGVYHKILGRRATTESTNGQDHPVQLANYCNHLLFWRAQLVPAIERPFSQLRDTEVTIIHWAWNETSFKYPLFHLLVFSVNKNMLQPYQKEKSLVNRRLIYNYLKSEKSYPRNVGDKWWLKGCVRYIFASLFFKSKGELLWN